MLNTYSELLNRALKGHYAVGAFNTLSVENVIGAIQAAEELHSPIILQLAEVQFPTAPIDYMAPIMLAAAHLAKVPIAVHLDHGNSYKTCEHAAELGFTGVMFDGAALPIEENIRITKQVVVMAKQFGIGVEAELGKVGNAGDLNQDVFTDVEESAYFIGKTGIDALAIAIGNKHGKYIATPKLNIQRLTEISQRNLIPLVLHGGSGTSEEDFKSCVHHGICKINVATAIQLRALSKIKPYLNSADCSYEGMKAEIISATKEVVMEHIRVFESDGKA